MFSASMSTSVSWRLTHRWRESIWPVSECRLYGVAEFCEVWLVALRRRKHDTGVQHTIRVEGVLDRAERGQLDGAECPAHLSPLRGADSVFARQRATELERRVGDLFCDGFDSGELVGFVEDGWVQVAVAGMPQDRDVQLMARGDLPAARHHLRHPLPGDR